MGWQLPSEDYTRLGLQYGENVSDREIAVVFRLFIRLPGLAPAVDANTATRPQPAAIPCRPRHCPPAWREN
jgi:hypothetical protein